MLGGSHRGGAAPTDAACSTPTSPAKASRRDHSQTTPRSNAMPLPDEFSDHAPPRLRLPAADAEASFSGEWPSTGLTPLAGRMRLNAPSFSPLQDGQHQPTQMIQQAPHPGHYAAATSAPAVPPYYQHVNQGYGVASKAYNPLGAAGSELHVASSSGTAAATAAAAYQPSGISQAYAAATTAAPQTYSNYQGHHSYLEAARTAAAAQNAAPPSGPSAPRTDPSWPYLPGMSVVETTTTAPTRPPPLSIPPAQLARLQAPPVAGVSPKAPGPTTPQPNQIPAAGSPSPSPPQHRPGMVPSVALRTLGALLTSYEKAELLSYPEIWFAGRSLNPKIRGSVASGLPNAGYDDARGDYLAVPGDHVAYRYEIMGALGRGSFGQVVKALDHATGATLALKIIRNRSRFARQAATEAGILGALAAADPGGASGIVRMLDSFSFRGHNCITFELLGANLYEHLRGGGFAGVPPPLARRVTAQVLRTLVFLSQHNLVHCDVKPENILLAGRGSSVVKLIDFGSSCYADRRVYTYIQSRFYRAPEVMLGLPYGPPIDVWSLACVVAELLTGSPLFPGEDEADQLARVAEVLGPPPRVMLQQGTRAKAFFDVSSGAPTAAGLGRPDARGRLRRPGAVTLRAAMKGRADVLLLDFLERCQRWDPAERLTPAEALAHPWVVGQDARTATATAATQHFAHGQQHYQQTRLGPLGGAALTPHHQTAPWK